MTGPQELLAVIGATLVAAGVLTLVATRFEPVLRFVEDTLTYLSTGVIVFVMAYVSAEVLMRYGFNAPLPGHLEGAELLVPIIVFFAISYTQARNGHVGMTLVVDALPPRGRMMLEISTLALSWLLCGIMSYFAGKYALQLFRYDDVTMSPPYWRTWPSAAAISLGYALVAMRMWMQILHHLKPGRFPPPPDDEIAELHSFE
jgi:TRAP-type C4-dicarboxylate transport system permease small subunit